MTINIYIDGEDVVVLKNVKSIRTYEDLMWFRCVYQNRDIFEPVPISKIVQVVIEP